MRLLQHEKTALVLAALPFVVYIGERATASFNGVTIVRWDYNFAGVILGLIALFVVYLGVRELHASIVYRLDPRAPHHAIFTAISLLAIYQIAKGASLLI